MTRILDDIGLGSLVFVAGLVALVVGYIGDDISFDQLWQNLLYLGGGSGAIGYVRNQAGKGVRR